MDKIHLALVCIGAAHAIGFAGLGAGIGMGWNCACNVYDIARKKNRELSAFIMMFN